MQTDFIDILTRDVLIGSSYLIGFILAMLAWWLFRKGGRKITSTLGMGIYFITFAVYSIANNLGFLYQSYLPVPPIEMLGTAVWIAGIQFFIFSVEKDLSQIDNRSYKITKLTLLYLLIMTVLLLFGLPNYILFIGLSIGIVYVTSEFLDMVLRLETAKRSFPQYFFIVGFIMSGFSNFYVILDYTASGFLVKNTLILFGALCLVYSWWEIPAVSDLNWLLSLERLIVIDSESSLPIVDFAFRENGLVTEETTSDTSKEADGALVAGAISGIDSLIGEILADAGGLDEITHGKKTIVFHRREEFTCMLIADESVRELRYRLEVFGINFERKYKDELKRFEGNVEPFKDSGGLIREVFS